MLPVSWDLETHLIKPGMMAPKMVCLSTDNGNTSCLHDYEQGLIEAKRLIKEEFTVGHHLFFDLGVIAAEDSSILPDIFKAIDSGRIHCTKIRQMMIDNAKGDLKFIWDKDSEEFKKQNFSLARLVQRHLGFDISHKKLGNDIWRLRYNELDGIPLSKWPEDAKSYAIEDAKLTLGVWQSQERQIAPDKIPGFVSQMQAAWALNLLSTWGLRTDEKSVSDYKRSLEIEYNNTIKKCQEFGFRRSGAGATRDMAAIRSAIEKWCKDNNEELPLTPKGGISTNREQLIKTNHPGLHAVAESVRVEKLLTTYIAALERGTRVPLNPSYNSIIETFRTSCSNGMKIDKIPVGMNVQNLPRGGKVRECVIPRKGSVFVFCDYDTLEMLTLAQVCLDLFGYSEIANAAKQGVDFHIALAADIFGISYRDAVDRYKAGDRDITNARQYCKIGNYGFGGGMGTRSFIQYAKGYGLDIKQDLAKILWSGFRKKWPEMNDYFNHCSFLCAEGIAEKIVFVRSGMVRGKVNYTATCNGFFQHLAAMGAKKALYDVVRECYVDSGSPLYGCRPWLFAHDEIGMEIPYDGIGPQRAHDAAMRLKEVMIASMSFWCPDVPVQASLAMTRRWYKGAKDVYNKGLLVPCKPEGRNWVIDL